jgi:hypothetical protein
MIQETSFQILTLLTQVIKNKIYRNLMKWNKVATTTWEVNLSFLPQTTLKILNIKTNLCTINKSAAPLTMFKWIKLPSLAFIIQSMTPKRESR